MIFSIDLLHWACKNAFRKAKVLVLGKIIGIYFGITPSGGFKMVFAF
jgi:hypothetical protein